MNLIIFLVPLIISTLILTGIGIYSLRLKNTPGALPFAGGVFTAAIWAATFGIDLFYHSLNEKILVSQIRFTLSSPMVVLWLIMVIEHTRRSIWFTKKRFILLMIIPVFCTCLIWMPEYYHLFRYNYHTETHGIITVLLFDKGPFVLVHLLYIYILMTISWFLLLKGEKGEPPLFYRQNLMIFASLFIPTVIDMLFQMGISFVKGYNLTPSIFSITSLFLAWALFRCGALDIIPIGRSTVIDNIKDLMLILDNHGRLVDINKSAIRALSLDIKKIIGINISSVLVDWPALLNFYQKGNIHGEIIEGGKFYEISIDTINGKKGNAIGKMIILTDITIKKSLEDRARESEEYYRTLVNTSPDGISLFDKEGNITFVSKKSYELYGIKEDSPVIGQNILRWVHPDYHEKAIRKIKKLLEKEISSGTLEYRMLKDDGTVFWGELAPKAILDKNGTVKEILTITRDITERKKMEENLIRAKEEAEAANYAKSMFLANMSHEIRTPMTGIMGMIDLLLTTETTMEQKDYIETLKSSSETLISIINDILDFSKIEAGKLELEIITFNLKSILKDLYNLFSLKFQEKNILYSSLISPEIPVYLKGDPIRIRQILINLLSNAIKFTSHGDVKLEIELLKEEKEKIFLKFSVKDTGIGVPEEKKKLIFKPFSQADISHARKFGGTGLGLTISKELCEMMGGEIDFHSEEGKGTEFIFIIPLEKSSEEIIIDKIDTLQSLRRSINEYSILLAEDNFTNQKLIKNILEKSGYNTMVASNGNEALILLSSQKFDLVFMDCQMPERDGYDTTKILRSKEFPDMNRNIPVIALTASTQKGEREACINSGMNDYMTKPFKLENLIYTAEKWLNISNGNISFPEPDMDKDSKTWDKETFMKRLDNDRNMAQEIIVFLIEDTKKNIFLLKEAIEEKNINSTILYSHSLKGSSSLAGADIMTSICEKIEFMAKNKDLENIEIIISELEKEFENFINEFTINFKVGYE